MSEQPITFGFGNFWPVAYAAFPKFWNVSTSLVDAINDLAFGAYANVGPLGKVIINLSILGATSLVEIMTLVGNGLGFGAQKITRSMLEITINAEFLRRFPKHLDDYIDWSNVERWRMKNYLAGFTPNSLTPQMISRIDQEFQAVKTRFATGNGKKLRASWCSIPLDQRAVLINLQDAYGLFYPRGNNLLHGTIHGMSLQASHNIDDARLPFPPSLEGCQMALQGAHLCALQIVRTVSQAMSRENISLVEALDGDYSDAWLGTE